LSKKITKLFYQKKIIGANMPDPAGTWDSLNWINYIAVLSFAKKMNWKKPEFNSDRLKMSLLRACNDLEFSRRLPNFLRNSIKFIVWSNGSVINRTGSYGTISDIKFKENVVDATPKLDDILKLQVRNFNLIGDNKKQIGFIAQEFEEVFPSMVDISIDKNTKEEYKSIKTTVLIPMLVKAIQELKSENDALKEILQRNNIS
jgi:hypothetical protein